MKRPYRNYIFDLYGTLVDIRTDESAKALWKQLALFLRYRGVACEAEQLQRDFLDQCGRAEKEEEEKLEKEGIPGPPEIDLVSVWESILKHYDAAFSQEALQDFLILFRSLSLKKLALYPGAVQVLQELKKKGKNVVLLTNAQVCFTVPELKMLGSWDLFDRIFISSEAGVSKPSPAFYGLLAENGYALEESVMIGNDAVCDCFGAANVGMDSVFIRTGQSPKGRAKLPPGCVRIRELRDLLFFERS